MKRSWREDELIERWTLLPDELALLSNRAGHTRLGFAVMVRFFAEEERFPRDKGEVPAEVLRFVGEQVGVGSGPEAWLRYDWSGRSVKYHRSQVRGFFGFAEATAEEVVLVEGVVPAGWRFLVVREDDLGRGRVDRVGYEVCALRALRDALRRREV